MNIIYLELYGLGPDVLPSEWANRIALQSYSYGTSLPMQANDSYDNTPRPSGAAMLMDLNCTKNIDAISPTLYLLCCQGEHIARIVLNHYFFQEGVQEPLEARRLWRVTLHDCLITSVNGSGYDPRPTESVSIAYRQIKWEYFDNPEAAKTAASSWNLTQGEGAYY